MIPSRPWHRWATAPLAMAVLAGCGAGTSGEDSPGAAAARLATKSFAVFARAERAGDEIPVGQANGGVKPALSRLVYAGPRGMLFAYVHNGLLCLSYATRVSATGAGSASGGCDTVAGATAAGLAAPIAARLDRLDRLALVVPNGVRSVTLTLAGGSQRTLRVQNNAIVYAGEGLRGWTFRTAGGVRHSGAMPGRSPAVATQPAAGGATGAGRAVAVHPTVAPAQGGPTTVFVVSLVAGADLGSHGGLTTRYLARLDRRTGAAPLTPGCGGAGAPSSAVGTAGTRLELTLRPGPSGWCRATYQGSVLLERGPAPGAVVGRFTFVVG